MISCARLTLLIPFHNDYHRLKPTLARVAEAMDQIGISEVILCHNGPALDKEAIELIHSWMPPRSKWIHTDIKGIGAGYKAGVEIATGDHIIFSQSDLPFGWSDVEGFLKLEQRPDFAMGSKDHPHSVIEDRPLKRMVATWTFKWLRKLILGLRTPGDSQGTFIVHRDTAKKLAKLCCSDDYLFSLEMVTWHLAHKGDYVEVPVRLEPEVSPSNIRVVQDGFWMLLGLCKLALKTRIPISQKSRRS